MEKKIEELNEEDAAGKPAVKKEVSVVVEEDFDDKEELGEDDFDEIEED
jgi:hypothetical protein